MERVERGGERGVEREERGGERVEREERAAWSARSAAQLKFLVTLLTEATNEN